MAPTGEQADLLRFTTAGSVDDGKSTLIGRLLYDTKAVYDDQLVSIAKSGINRSDGPLDLSLLTDGLRAEREQGITIDVAYRYFSTSRRKFIIADTPGHEQYTRNMASGASTAHAAVVLVDATKGLLTQSRRHTYIASLLGIRHVIAAVNKMDLVDYRQEVFETIARDFEDLAGRLGIANAYVTPVSALKGDNIVTLSARMPWFGGSTLLEYLEKIPVETNDADASGPLRLPIQYVIRPDSRFRGFAGRVASGNLRRGDSITVIPSRVRTRVKSITTFDGELDQAGPGSSITVALEDEIDISRGDLLAGDSDLPQSATAVTANVVWLSTSLSSQREFYFLKHTTRTVRARLKKILYRVDVNTLDHRPASSLHVNDIAAATIETTLPLFFDSYRDNRTTGSFILIDPVTNATVAAGMIEAGSEQPRSQGSVHEKRRVPAAMLIVGRQSVAERLVHLAQKQDQNQNKYQGQNQDQDEAGRMELVSGAEFEPAQLLAVASVLRRMGITAILHLPQDDPALKQSVISTFGERSVFHAELPADESEAVTTILDWLSDLEEVRDQR
jgi:bifunctional enzyme CysN/CysC/sulfate adenylyltransferase subunit 1